MGSSGQVTWGMHVTEHKGEQRGDASPEDLKLSGMTLGTKEKVECDNVKN